MKIAIEPILKSHISLVHLYASDERISETCNVPNPYTREMADDWYEQVCYRQDLGVSKVFAVIANAEFSGVIALNSIDSQLKHAEIDYWIGVEFQGRGIASSAVSLIIRKAYKSLGIDSFSCRSLATNKASHAVQKKNGFTVVDKYTLLEGKFVGEEFVVAKLKLNG